MLWRKVSCLLRHCGNKIPRAKQNEEGGIELIWCSHMWEIQTMIPGRDNHLVRATKGDVQSKVA
jgi:hypothetical protein